MADTLELPPEPRTVEEAREIIHNIRFRQGCRDEDDEAEIRKTSTDYQAKLRWEAEHARRTLARFTKVIASQLYSSKYRFIYELIQNADDANYQKRPKEKAEKGLEKGSQEGSEKGPMERDRKKPPKKPPHLTFRIRPKELIVETNEKGFNVANVYAICATGESSKTGDLETTGEKGLGFKSVFGIADEVHVQSGLWSFCFKHSKKDDGLGMVSPIWKDECHIAPNAGTRFTLKYSEKSQGFLKTLIQKFDEIPENVVMFLRKLEKVTITFEDVEQKAREKTFARTGKLKDGEVSILTTIDGRETKHIYIVVMHTMTDMPEEEAREDQKESTMTLAFPIDLKTQMPSISERGQHVSAFLPIQRIPQIPANFVVAANRETIPDTPWNQKLRTAAAQAFAKAILQFWDESDPLRYHWMRYLPFAHVEGFWEPLYEEIIDSVRYLDILESMEGGSLKRATDLRTLPSEFIYYEEPLLPDLDDDIYLSGEYDKLAVAKLRDLGLRDLSGEDMLDRVEADLRKGKDSQIRSTELGEVWHTSFIEFLECAWEDDSLKARIKTIDILPLSSGKWVAPCSANTRDGIYFPHIEDNPDSPLIPIGLGLRTLHPTACVVTGRASFYTVLGVGHATPKLLVQRVLDANSRSLVLNTSEYVVHLEILYWLGPELAPVKPETLLGVSHHDSVLGTPSLYFRSDQQYHAEKLLEFTDTSSVTACEDLDFGFLNDAYVKSQVSKQFKDGKSWSDWLRMVAGVPDYPKLIYWWDPPSMNPVLEAIIRDNPSQLVGLLGAHWQDYESCVTPEIAQKLMESKVPCQNGEMHELRQTFLPTTETISKSRDFGVQPQMRFLAMGEGKNVVKYNDWVFLEQFGVCCATDLTFHFETLRTLKESKVDEKSTTPAPVKLYISLGSIAQLKDKQRVQDFFETEDLIYRPNTADCWISVNSCCVWDGPEFLRYTYVLKNDYAKYPEVRGLFVDFLEIGDANSDHVLDEIITIKGGKPLSDGSNEIRSVDTTTMCTIYETLSKMAESEDYWDFTRESFEEANLVFVNEKWIAPSMCIWNSSVKLSGYVTIEDVYPNLRTFFVGKLNVRTVNTAMMLQELPKAANLQKVSDIKEIMCAIGSMLCSEEDLDIFESIFRELRKCKFLPILNTDKSCSFEAPIGQFLIVDHERYGAAFKDKLRFLDFSHDELTSLHPLFKALKLESRYLSGLVDTETAVGESTESESLSNDLRQRAFAISCCAISHRSHKFLNHDDQAHKMLMESEIRVSNELWTGLIVRQGSEEVKANSDRALLKIEQSEKNLKVYLPCDVSKRKLCYSTQMPNYLMSILGIVGDGAEKQVYRLLNEPVLELDRVMEDEDIPAASWLERVPIPSPPEDSLSRSDSDPAEPLTVYVEGQRGNLLSDDTIRFLNASDPEFPASAVHSEAGKQDRYQYLFQDAVPDDLYRHLLQSVVTQACEFAQQTSTESEDAFSTSSLQNALEEISPTELHRALGAGLGQMGTFEGNARIGAAGELFVYETLRAAGMPGFDLNNWQSRIRHYVRVLPKYRGLGRWLFGEIADIMYEDHTDDMELFLRENSFDEFPEWYVAPSDSRSGDSEDGSDIDNLGGSVNRMESVGSDDGHNFDMDIDEPSEVGRDEDGTYDPLQSENEDGEEENEDGEEENEDGEEENEDGEEENEDGEEENEDGEEENEDEQEVDDEDDSKGSVSEDPILYQIEVKTTTGPCDTPFFMSKSQYGRMKQNALIPGKRPRTVYVIVRVFDLLSKNIGAKIFVDPCRLADETLEFVSGGWKVKLRT